MPIFRVKSVKIYTGQKNLHGVGRVGDNYLVCMRVYARECRSIPLWQIIPEYARVCQSMLEPTSVFQGKQKYAKLCQSMPEFAIV